MLSHDVWYSVDNDRLDIPVGYLLGRPGLWYADGTPYDEKQDQRHEGGGVVDASVRPSWDKLWIDLAQSLSLRSTCSRLQVGAVIVTMNNQQVLGVGYNGGPRGMSNACLSLDPGSCGHLHAEVNAALKAEYSIHGKKMYVTTQPCYLCAVVIINSGISEVIYRDTYRVSDGLNLLKEAGISVTQYQG